MGRYVWYTASMNTKLVAGIVGLVAVAGGAYYFMNMSGGASGTEDASGAKESAEAGAFSGSVFALAERGGDWKCTVDASAQTGGGEAVSSGVVYVSDKKIRADFTTTVQGFGNVDSHMVADGTNVYSWTSMMPQGFKVAQTAAGEGGTETSGGGFDANQSYSYDCQPTSADSSRFTPPAHITFTELNF